MGIVCPGGSILLGSLVQGDRKWGTGSPGIKWVWDQMRHSQYEIHNKKTEGLLQKNEFLSNCNSNVMNLENKTEKHN